MRGGRMSIVNWHSKLQVLSLDFHPVSGCLATAGADLGARHPHVVLALPRRSGGRLPGRRWWRPEDDDDTMVLAWLHQ